MKIKKMLPLDIMITIVFALIIYTGVGGIFVFSGELVMLFLLLISIKSITSKNGCFIKTKRNFFDFYVIIILALVVYSYTISYCRSETMPYVIRFVVYILLYQFIFDIDKVVLLLNYMIKYAAIIAVVYIICYPIFGPKTGILNSYQSTGISMSIALSIIVAKYFAYDKIKRNEYFYAGLMLLALMMTGKRMLLVIPVIELILLFLVIKNRDKYKKTFRIITIVSFVFPLMYILIPSARLVVTRIIEGVTDTTLSYRTYFWEYALMMWKSKPVMGWGFGTMPYHIGHAGVDLKEYGYIRSYAAHNIYYQMLAEIGIVGCVLFCFFFASFLIYSIYKARKLKAQLTNNERFLLYISIVWQIWFIVYGFTGNPLYMIDECWLYFIALILFNSVCFRKQKVMRIKIR